MKHQQYEEEEDDETLEVLATDSIQTIEVDVLEQRSCFTHTLLRHIASDDNNESIEKLSNEIVDQSLQDYISYTQYQPFSIAETIEYTEQLTDDHQRIGQGGFASVYIGQHKKNKIIYALKVIKTNNCLDVKEVLREAIIQNYANSINSMCFIEVYFPIIVRQPQNSQFSMILQQQKGEYTLQDYIRKTPIGEEEFESIAYQILTALLVLHLNRIAHRDIKPSNIIYVKEKGWVLADFGCSQVYEYELGEYVMAGTPAYLPKYIYDFYKIRLVKCRQNLFYNDLYACKITVIQILRSDMNMKQISDILNKVSEIQNPLCNKILNIQTLEELASLIPANFNIYQQEFILSSEVVPDHELLNRKLNLTLENSMSTESPLEYTMSETNTTINIIEKLDCHPDFKGMLSCKVHILEMVMCKMYQKFQLVRIHLSKAQQLKEYLKQDRKKVQFYLHILKNLCINGEIEEFEISYNWILEQNLTEVEIEDIEREKIGFYHLTGRMVDLGSFSNSNNSNQRHLQMYIEIGQLTFKKQFLEAYEKSIHFIEIIKNYYNEQNDLQLFASLELAALTLILKKYDECIALVKQWFKERKEVNYLELGLYFHMAKAYKALGQTHNVNQTNLTFLKVTQNMILREYQTTINLVEHNQINHQNHDFMAQQFIKLSTEIPNLYMVSFYTPLFEFFHSLGFPILACGVIIPIIQSFNRHKRQQNLFDQNYTRYLQIVTPQMIDQYYYEFLTFHQISDAQLSKVIMHAVQLYQQHDYRFIELGSILLSRQMKTIANNPNNEYKMFFYYLQEMCMEQATLDLYLNVMESLSIIFQDVFNLPLQGEKFKSRLESLIKYKTTFGSEVWDQSAQYKQQNNPQFMIQEVQVIQNCAAVNFPTYMVIEKLSFLILHRLFKGLDKSTKNYVLESFVEYLVEQDMHDYFRMPYLMKYIQFNIYHLNNHPDALQQQMELIDEISLMNKSEDKTQLITSILSKFHALINYLECNEYYDNWLSTVNWLHQFTLSHNLEQSSYISEIHYIRTFAEIRRKEYYSQQLYSQPMKYQQEQLDIYNLITDYLDFQETTVNQKNELQFYLKDCLLALTQCTALAGVKSMLTFKKLYNLEEQLEGPFYIRTQKYALLLESLEGMNIKGIK